MRTVATILIIEDSTGYAYLVERQIRQLLPGASLSVVPDGHQALVALEQQAFDLVILDLDLPRVSGLTVLKALKRHAERLMIPVVVLSQHADNEHVWQAYQANANAFLVKPHDIDDLQPTLAALIDFWFRVAKLPQAPLHPITF